MSAVARRRPLAVFDCHFVFDGLSQNLHLIFIEIIPRHIFQPPRLLMQARILARQVFAQRFVESAYKRLNFVCGHCRLCFYEANQSRRDNARFFFAKRSTSAPWYQPLADKKSLTASSRDVPSISVARSSSSSAATLRRFSALNSGFQTTAIIVPARFNHAPSTPGCRSRSKRIGFEALPQPIRGAAGQTNGTLNTPMRSVVTAAWSSAALASGA